MAETLPILYSFRRCPYAMRARMALLVSGRRCELREVLLRDKPEPMVEISPKATVPVLQLPDGEVLDESLNIMRWTLRENDPEGWLEPGGEEAKALIADIDGAFKHHLDRYKYYTRYDSDPVEHRQAAMEILAKLDGRLGDHANLFGSDRSFADIAIFPFVRQFAATDRDWFDAQPIKPLRNWLQCHLDSVLFARTMVKFDQWAAGDPQSLLPEYRAEDPAC